jgi:hypothetical protein
MKVIEEMKWKKSLASPISKIRSLRMLQTHYSKDLYFFCVVLILSRIIQSTARDLERCVQAGRGSSLCQLDGHRSSAIAKIPRR